MSANPVSRPTPLAANRHVPPGYCPAGHARPPLRQSGCQADIEWPASYQVLSPRQADAHRCAATSDRPAPEVIDHVGIPVTSPVGRAATAGSPTAGRAPSTLNATSHTGAVVGPVTDHVTSLCSAGPAHRGATVSSQSAVTGSSPIRMPTRLIREPSAETSTRAGGPARSVTSKRPTAR